MVSRRPSCWPVRPHSASRIGLLLLLKDEGDTDEDGNDLLPHEGLEDGVLHLATAVNTDPQPRLEGHEGIKGIGVLPPSHGEAGEDLQEDGEGFLLLSQGHAENNLLPPRIEGRKGKEKEGFDPIADQGFVPVVSGKEKMGFAPYKYQRRSGPADKLGTNPVAADAEGPNPAPEKGSIPIQKMASNPKDAADGYDAEPDAPADGEDAESDDEMGPNPVTRGALLLESDASADEGACDAHADSEDADDNTTSDDAHVDAIEYADVKDYEEGASAESAWLMKIMMHK